MKKIVLLVLSIIVMLTAIGSFLLICADLLNITVSAMPWVERLMTYPLPVIFMKMIGDIGLGVLLFILYKRQSVSEANE